MPYRCAARLLAGALGLMGLAQPGAADVLDDALAAAGVSRPAVTLPRAHGPRAGLPLTEAMLSQPLDAAYRAGLVEAAAMAGLEHVPDLVVLASSLLEAEVAVAGVPAEGMAPLLAAADPLAYVVSGVVPEVLSRLPDVAFGVPATHASDEGRKRTTATLSGLSGNGEALVVRGDLEIGRVGHRTKVKARRGGK